MNSKRKAIARACLASLVGLAPATPALAIQLHSPIVKAVPDASPTFSILEPIPDAAAVASRPAENARLKQQPAVPPSTTRHAAGGTLSMFQQVDAIAVAAATPENSLVPAGFELEDSDERPSLVGLANIEPSANRLQLPVTHSNAAAEQSSLASPTNFTRSTGETIFVHPPTSRPTAPNRHYVRIENTGDLVAKNVVVELNVPAGARVMEVVPYDTTVVGQTARYRLREIEAGQSITVELTTTPDSPVELAFVSRYTMDPLQRIARRPTSPVPPQAQRPVEAPLSGEPALRAPVLSTPQAAAETQPPATAMQVRSGAAARQAWQQDSRLKYGATSIPGPVLVANPRANVVSSRTTNKVEAEASEPFPRTPSSVALGKDLLAKEAFAVEQSVPDVDSDSIEPQAVAARTTPNGLKLASQLRTRIEGPQHAVTGEEAEYEVVVENNSIKDAKDVIVQLSIPAGLEVTTLDRSAWFDGKARTVTWKIPAVDAGNSETIRYLAKVTSPIGQLQKVTLGVENKFRGQATFQSTVMEQYELAAPLMSFEKDAKSLK